MSSKSKKSRTRTKSHHTPRVPNVYPSIPSYSIPAPQWIPPQPYQWYQPMPNMPPMPNIPAMPNTAWMPHSPGSNSATITTNAGLPTRPSDEYTVDSLRGIYNNDDGSIEIERVKVQRRQGIYDTKQGSLEGNSESQSLVPAGHFFNERRPPPRKHKRKVTDVAHKQEEVVPIQGWYPYMPYMPQPYPYAYPYGYVWPMPPHSPINYHPQFNSPTDDSDSSASHQEPFSVSMDSPILQAKSMSPESQRPLSSATGSHVAESLGTDIAPSDSVSMRGFKRETSIERILRKSLEDTKDTHKTISEPLTSKDIEKTKEWMEDMQKAFESKSRFSSEVTGDRSSFTTAPSDIPTPPIKSRVLKDSTSKIILTHRKSNSESNIDNHEDPKNASSLPLLENTRVSESDLMCALNNTENRSDRLKLNELTEDNIAKLKSTSDHGGRDSCTSTTSFHSTRQSADENIIDTDSTDIAIPLDSSTADESVENFDEDTVVDDFRDKNYKWILQNVDDLSSEGEQNEENNTSEIIESWRTEVSLWRARLVVSLCRGQGLDQQDWGTFNLLVQHPLALDMKLSLLHAQRICSQNYDVGVALLRNSLLHLTTFGETLMKPENERTQGWKTITIDSNQPWVLIKGSLEILRVFGFRIRRNGTLRYKEKYSPEISVIARLTLDMLVLAEEFRLFLNGAHQYPINITQLFTAARDFKYDKKFCAKGIEQDSLTDTSKSDHHLQSESSTSDSKNLSEIIHFDLKPQNNSDSVKLLTSVTSVPAIERIPVNNFNEDQNNSANQSSDSTPTKESLPDLLSSNANLSVKYETSDKDTGSRETLIPTPTLQTKEDGIAEADSKGAMVNKTEKGRTRRVVNGKDNPEDHVYEEIGDIKEQVEELKRSESASQSPPPLPPKTKNHQNEDLYPQVDWSISSNYSSLHGSASRRKKRRAPMPPEFLNYDSKETATDTLNLKDKVSTDDDAFDIEKTELNKNPFYEERIKPAGFVGKNPFYEDLDTKHKTQVFKGNSGDGKEEMSPNADNTADEVVSEKENQTFATTFSASSVDDISEISSCSTLPAGVRPQRRKKKKVQKVNTDSEEVSKVLTEMISNTNVVNLHHDVNDQLNIRQYKEKPKDISKHITYTKNEVREHQCSSQVVVPNENKTPAGERKTESSKCTTNEEVKLVAVPNESKVTESKAKNYLKDSAKKDVIFQKISITYDISLEDNKMSVNKKTDLKIPNDKSILEKSNMSDNQSKEKNSSSFNRANLSSVIDTSFLKKEGDIPTTVSSGSIINKNNESYISQQYAKVQKVRTEPTNLSESSDIPPILPPKPTMRLIDDIPYIDSNDVKNYKRNYVTSERKQPPHFGLSELKSNEVINMLDSNSEEKMCTFLKRSSFVPFIDDSDNPPDSEPPSPPPSPTQTPLSPPTLAIVSISSTDFSQPTLQENVTVETSISLHSDKINKLSQPSSNELDEKSQTQELPTTMLTTPIINSLSISEADVQLSKSTNTHISNTNNLEPTDSIKTFDLPQNNIIPPLPLHSPPPSPLHSPPPSPLHSPLPSPLHSPPPSPLHSPPPSPLHAPPHSPPPSPLHSPPHSALPSPLHSPSHSLSSPLHSLPPSPPHSPPPSPPNTLLTLCMQKKTVIENNVQITTYNSPSASKESDKSISLAEEEMKKNLNNFPLGEKEKILIETDNSRPVLLPDVEDSEHKSLMMFGTEFSKDNNSTQELGSPQYEIPETPTLLEDVEEDQYEIPNISNSTEVSHSFPRKNIREISGIHKNSEKDRTEYDEDNPPKRPPRHLHAFKIPPPRPPKPELNSCPPLPPKTGSLKSSKSSSTSSQQSSSLPSTLIKTSNNNKKKIQPSPLAIPAMYRSIPDSIAKSKHETCKASSLTSIPTTESEKISIDSSNTRGLARTSKPPSECVSLPSSPKTTKPLFKKVSKDEKKQKSWPFLLCDCVHPTGSNDDIKYVIK